MKIKTKNKPIRQGLFASGNYALFRKENSMTISLMSEINDKFRQSRTCEIEDNRFVCYHENTTIQGRFIRSKVLEGLLPEDQVEIINKVIHYEDDFVDCPEHNFGSFHCRGFQVMWKIDCFHKIDHSIKADPLDLANTFRTLTILVDRVITEKS